MKTLSNFLQESFTGEQIDESAEQINESFIIDLISELSRDEMAFLLGIIGGAGIIITASTYSKVIDAVKKKGGPIAKKIVDKLETAGSAASATVHHR